jgi:DNA-binding CsgD family transcriptional regulator
MIGRSRALARLHGAVEAAAVASCDGPEIVLVSGEAGIGKTRLLREFLDGLEPDVRVFTAAAQPGSQGRPYEVLAPLFAAHSEPLEDEARARAVIDTLRVEIERGPTVVVVDDLHWIDSASAFCIERMLQQPWPQLVVVATFRPEALSRMSPGGDVVARLEGQHAVEQVRLDRLDRNEVATMAAALTGEPASSSVLDALMRRSGGVPFVVEELLRGLAPGSCSCDITSAHLPWTLDDAVAQQLAGLGSSAQPVAEALAIGGDPCSFDVLGHVTGLDEAVLVDSLRELIALGIVVESQDDRFVPAHALMGDVVARRLMTRERRRLHERFLTALQTSDSPDAASLARHADGAGRFEQIAAIARSGARRYLRQGASFQALRLASDGLSEEPDDPELLAVATDAAWRCAFNDEAEQFAERWVGVETDLVKAVEAWRMYTRLAHERGDDGERDSRLAAFESWLAGVPEGVAQGRGFGAIAQIQMLSGRRALTVEWGERALAHAERFDDAWLRAQAMVELASNDCDHAEETTLIEGLVAAADAAAAVDDDVLEARALNNLFGHASARHPQMAVARARLRSVSDRGGLDLFTHGLGLLFDTDAAFWAGDQAALRRVLADAAGSLPNSKQHAHFTYTVALLRLEEGRCQETLDLLDSLVGEKWSAPVASLRLLASGLLGKHDVVADAWTAVLGNDLRTPADVCIPDVVGAAAAAGVPTAQLRADLPGLNMGSGPVSLMVEGVLCLAEHRSADAVAALENALADESAIARPVAGTIRIGLAHAHRAQGSRAAALDLTEQAISHDLAKWPGWRRDRAEALLRRLQGSHGRGDGGLTARELEVASLISEGLTNGQLAERLFISPKTAAVHVSNILMKLGLSGRAEVAAWVARRGLHSAAS